MTLRIEAGLSMSCRCLESVRDPTGSPVSIYARTIEVRISRYLKFSGASVVIDPKYYSTLNIILVDGRVRSQMPSNLTVTGLELNPEHQLDLARVARSGDLAESSGRGDIGRG